MLFIASRFPLKSVFPATPCWCQTVRCLRPPTRQTVFETVFMRFANTKAPSKGQSAAKPTLTRKPPRASIPREVHPLVSEILDSERNQRALSLARDGKAMLFKASSHAGFLSAAWLGGVVCIGGGLLIIDMGLVEANDELPSFVPSSYRVSVIFLFALGCFSISKSFRLISSIEILPRNGKAMLLLNVRRNIPLPFIKPKPLVLHLSDVSLSRRMVAAIGQPVPDASSSGIASRIRTAPYRFFVGVRQFISSDRLAHLHVKGHSGTWKLDSNGLFPHGGRPLFSLVDFTT